MDAVHQLSQAIVAGDIECGIAVGVEDMFAIPMGGFNPSFHPKLAEMDYYIGMGETAENLAQDLEIARDRQEDFAVRSHELALKAWEAGVFANEVVAIDNAGEIIDATRARGNPIWRRSNPWVPLSGGGLHHGRDLQPHLHRSLGTDRLQRGLRQQARSDDSSTDRLAGRRRRRLDPHGHGSHPGQREGSREGGHDADDMDFIELNEAFAAQALYVLEKTGWPLDKVNIHGGAIALGHPLGASGARILTTLINVLEQNDAKTGLATMCIGTGQGIATVIERG